MRTAEATNQRATRPAILDERPSGEWQYARLAGPGREPPMIPEATTRPVMTAEEVFAELGIDRSTGYKAIRDGTFPLPVLRVGRTIRVPTVAVRRLLQLDPSRDTDKEVN